MLKLNIPSPITKLHSDFLSQKSIEVYVKRDDLIHDVISGNKWRKLKYHFIEAQKKKIQTILSFGGQYSNHLHALSYLSNISGFNSIGILRGNKNMQLNSTLSFCKSNNMLFHYINRYQYRFQKYSPEYLQQYKDLFGDYFLIPEGGNNILGVKGCLEILQEVDVDFDYVCCSVGTGCTASGIIQSLNKKQFLIGFCPFQKVFEQKKNIERLCNNNYVNWKLVPDLSFKGFGKIDTNLTEFVQKFYINYNIKLDLIYMGKLFYYLFNYIRKDFFKKKTKILVLHSGGLQGLKGFNFDFK